MRLGIFISDASGLRTDVDALLANARAAARLGFATEWVPHIPWSLTGSSRSRWPAGSPTGSSRAPP
jgi:hypothetical protein